MPVMEYSESGEAVEAKESPEPKESNNEPKESNNEPKETYKPPATLEPVKDGVMPWAPSAVGAPLPKVTTTLPDGSSAVWDPNGGTWSAENRTTGTMQPLTEADMNNIYADAERAFREKASEPARAAKMFSDVLSFFGEYGKTVGGWVKDASKPTKEEVERLRRELLERAGNDPIERAKILDSFTKGDIKTAADLVEKGPATSSSLPAPGTSGGMPPPGGRGGDEPGGRKGDKPERPILTPEQKAAQEVKVAIDQAQAKSTADRQAEQYRLETLARSYNPQAELTRYSSIDPSSAGNPVLAEAMRKYNDLLATTAESEANARRASEALSGATKLTAENRDAWKQYYNPADYKAQAVQAQAAQARASEVAPAVTLTGDYTADISRLSGYDPTIQRSAAREQSVEAMNMARDTAKGLRPSVAENQYLQDLDALIASQSAATAGVRGQDSALAQQAAARQAAAIGQKAVRETAGLRLQEQQAAEQAYAAQAQGLMIEDQKVASQEKTNELQQAMQITQANLENAKTALTKDSFNAEAINRVNQLNAQYQNQASQLNAQLQNTVNLSNMEQQNNVSLQNAMRALDAAKYAGSAAQAALQSQIGLERSDLLSQYGFGKDVTSARAETLGTVAAGLNTMAGTQLQEQEMKNVMDRWNLSRVDIQRAQEAARRLGVTRAVLKAAGPGGLLMVKVAEAAGIAPDAMNDIAEFLA